jgi:predicted TIM-barrel fold metal-dependent hydrolase
VFVGAPLLRPFPAPHSPSAVQVLPAAPGFGLGAAHPNLYGDLSDFTAHHALARDPEYGPKFLTEFQDRLLFGTDLCAPDMPLPLVDLLREWRDRGKISPEVFRKVARENAVRLFGLA